MLNCGKKLRQILALLLTLESCRVSKQSIKAVKASSLSSWCLVGLQRLECLKLSPTYIWGRLELDHLRSLPLPIP